MKIRSLLLGSIAAAGLTTGAFAADPAQVLTTLDLCDALGLTGLTVSSDNNCLQISGEVKYEFVWGDYRGTEQIAPSVGGYLVVAGWCACRGFWWPGDRNDGWLAGWFYEFDGEPV